MPLALALALRLLLGSGDCYFVTNTRILVLPTCDVSPDTIDALTEDPDPSRARAIPPRPAAWAQRRPNRQPWRPQPPVAVVGAKELEARLHDEQERRITEVARRLSAERQRDAAVHERDLALTKLADLGRELATARADCRSPQVTDASTHEPTGDGEATGVGTAAPRGTSE